VVVFLNGFDRKSRCRYGQLLRIASGNSTRIVLEPTFTRKPTLDVVLLRWGLSRSSRDELLTAVDVVRRARKRCVAHDVNGQGGDVRRSDDAPYGQRRAELGASFFKVISED
jgi:hypothetical protein